MTYSLVNASVFFRLSCLQHCCQDFLLALIEFVYNIRFQVRFHIVTLIVTFRNGLEGRSCYFSFALQIKHIFIGKCEDGYHKNIYFNFKSQFYNFHVNRNPNSRINYLMQEFGIVQTCANNL